MKNSAKPLHYTDLDGMRGLFACLVMLMHYGMNRIIGTIFRGHITGGHWELCVDFFFLLSGFVLCRSFLRRPLTLPLYLQGRARRLAPMYLVALAIMIAIPGHTDVGVAAANIAIVQSIIGITSINYPSWSIPFELFFPILMLFAIPFLSRAQGNILLVAFAVMLVLGMVATCLLVSGYDLRGLRAGSGLGLGAILYMVRERFDLSARRFPALLTPAITLLVILVIVVSTVSTTTILAFYPLAIVAVVAGAATQSIFSGALFQLLGRLSYSIYPAHPGHGGHGGDIRTGNGLS